MAFRDFHIWSLLLSETFNIANSSYIM